MAWENIADQKEAAKEQENNSQAEENEGEPK